MWNLIYVYLRHINIVLTTKYCLSCSGHQSFSLKKFLKMCVKLFIPVFPIYFLLTTRLGVELNLFCFVQYEGSVKLCSKLCAFVNIIMVFSILCVKFIVCFWWLTLMKEFSLGLIFIFFLLSFYWFFVVVFGLKDERNLQMFFL